MNGRQNGAAVAGASSVATPPLKYVNVWLYGQNTSWKCKSCDMSNFWLDMWTKLIDISGRVVDEEVEEEAAAKVTVTWKYITNKNLLAFVKTLAFFTRMRKASAGCAVVNQ